jgi:hypothetical protein
MLRPAADDEVFDTTFNGERWRLSWHPPEREPDGRPHSSAGICAPRP